MRTVRVLGSGFGILSERQLMALGKIGWVARLGKNTGVHIVAGVVFTLLIANLNALVDAVVHPEIPYFDQEHILVGSVTALVCTVLFAAVIAYVRHLRQALETIERLESLLRICSHCKRILKPEGDARNQDCWQPIEAFFTERTASEFTHGICPECFATHYAELKRESQRGASPDPRHSDATTSRLPSDSAAPGAATG